MADLRTTWLDRHRLRACSMGEHDIPLHVSTVDYHAGGEPFRIVTDGVRPLEGRTVLERRRFAREALDRVRRLIIDEPRGHADMYGCFVTEPDDAGADLGVVFFHNEGYSTACGHGTIALVTWAIESGRVPVRLPDATVTVDVPSGRLACVARMEPGGRHVASVRFRNVPSFVVARGLVIPTSRGPVEVQVSYGGAFYASVDVRALGLEVSAANLPQLIALQRELRPAIDRTIDVVHPDEPELRGIYGVIYWQEEPTTTAYQEAGVVLTQRNVTVFADGEVDRSPCGSGTSARLALLAADGRLGATAGGTLRHLSVVDTAFLGRVVGLASVADRPAVVTEIEGSAYLTGRHEFILDPRDPLGTGFLLR